MLFLLCIVIHEYYGVFSDVKNLCCTWFVLIHFYGSNNNDLEFEYFSDPFSRMLFFSL